MSANIRFSAIIPACDRGDSVREAVDSVLRQTFPPVEILIVDNGTESLPGTIFPRVMNVFVSCAIAPLEFPGAMSVR